MKGITWARDSHGLFDYESRNLTKRTMKANEDSVLYRKGNDIIIKPGREQYQPSEDETPLLTIGNTESKPISILVYKFL